jgi:hypothetical protein
VDTTERPYDVVRRSADIGAFLFLVAGVFVVPLLFWPWSADVFVGPKFDALRLFTAGGAAAAATWLATDRPGLRFRVPDVAASTFLALNVVAYFLSVDRGTSLLGEPLQQAGLVTVFALTGGYAVARITVRTLSRLTTLYSAAAAAGTLAAAYGVIQVAGVDPVWSSLPLGRAFATIGQPNWLAAYLVITIPLTVAISTATARGDVRLIGVGASLLQTFVLLSTLSRSGYLGLLVSIVVGGILAAKLGLRIPRNARRLFVGSVAAAIIAVLLLFGLSQSSSPVAPSTLARRLASTVDVHSFEARQYIALWEIGLAITTDNPMFGAGQDTYAIVFPEYRDRVLDAGFARHFTQFRPESAHNAYISISAGTGIPALIAYAVLIASTAIALLRHVRVPGRESILLAGIIAAMTGHAVTGWFITIDLSGSWLFWVLMGAGLTMVNHSSTPHPD